jgi:predicted phosphoribosyltransferase
VIVGHQIARHLRLPLDLVLATKVMAPGKHPAALGAVAVGGVVVPEPAARHSDRDLELLRRALAALEARLPALRGDTPLPDLRGRIVVLADDAAVTGLTMRAAVAAIAARAPTRLIVALGLCASEAEVRLREECDQLIGLDFTPTARAAEQHALDNAGLAIDDDEVRELVADAQRAAGGDLYQHLEIDG